MDTTNDTPPVPTADHLVDRWFALSASPRPDDLIALFAPDAVVEDDGHRHCGVDEIRAWLATVPPVRNRVLAVTPTPTGAAARAEASGDFPGSPIVFAYAFTTAGGVITHLHIDVAPADAETG